MAAVGLDAACGTLGAGVIRDGETQEQGGQARGNEYLHGELSFRSQADFESSRGAGHLAFARRLCGWRRRDALDLPGAWRRGQDAGGEKRHFTVV